MEINDKMLIDTFSRASLIYVRNLEQYFIVNYGKRALKHLWNEALREQETAREIEEDWFNTMTQRRYDKKEYKGRLV